VKDMIDKKKMREKVNHLRLLYVEDEEPLREQGEIFFKKFFSQVKVAVNGEDGLKLFKSEVFDIIISDIKMPKMYGDEMLIQIVHEAKKMEKMIFTTILTATIEESDIDQKVDCFLLKPIEFDQMFELLQKIEDKFEL
jgi:response regulator RpfG family c-di-GMP phosphodiesterase